MSLVWQGYTQETGQKRAVHKIFWTPSEKIWTAWIFLVGAKPCWVSPCPPVLEFTNHTSTHLKTHPIHIYSLTLFSFFFVKCSQIVKYEIIIRKINYFFDLFIHTLHRLHCVLFRKFKRMFTNSKECRQKSSIWYDIPAQCERYILVSTKTISIIPEVIFCVHVLEVEDGIFTSEDDLVPQNDLKLNFVISLERLKGFWVNFGKIL